ncbi:hypothetical protein BJ944DRAFT_275566 [Cunninghamella echinulata]|nr:hypothetical protein BJ944DRAFT_275566 [Cunninghamella echinulata]
MKTSFILSLIFLSFIQVMNAIPIKKRQNLTFNSPTMKTKWVVGRSESVVWKSESNDAVDILLAQEGTSDVIVVAQGINMYQGSYVFTVPDSVEPNINWKIIIKNTDHIFVTSDLFEIVSSSSSNIPYEYPPSEQALNDNHWVGSANITLIQPTASLNQQQNSPEHLLSGSNTATSDASSIRSTPSSFHTTLMISLILVSMTCFFFFL